jgi:hypothetical protein
VRVLTNDPNWLEREESIKRLVEDLLDVLREHPEQDVNNAVSAVFTLTDRMVIQLREMGANMAPVRASLHAMLAECGSSADQLPSWAQGRLGNA